MRKTIHTIFLFLLTFPVLASDVIEVKPLTNKILMVHFDDGYAIHHKRGEPRSNESVVINPLDVIKAMLNASYTLQSGDDLNYATLLSPLDIGRKSKPTEFGLMCQHYDKGCTNQDPDHALEHWVYLYLPHELQQGKSYTLTLDGMSSSSNTFTFTYDETVLHSEAIHVNNIGYSTSAPVKYGYIYHWLGDKGSLDLTTFAGKSFKLFNIDNSQSVFTGTIAFRKSKTNAETGQVTDTPNANFSSADVYECDFSSFNTPGNYKIVVEGIGSSFPFVIAADAYQEAFYWTMKGLYQNRSGIALEAPFTDLPRPAPHNPRATPGFSGRLKYSTFRSFDMESYDGAVSDKAKFEAAFKGELEDTYGWYQDAGDWDGYYTHTHVPAYLLFLYESGREKFTDGELNIPESDNSIADVLDEAAWLMRYFKRAKDEIKQKGWGTGGVPGARVFGDQWGTDTKDGDIGQGSWEDTARDWYVSGEDPWTTYKYAAMAAQLAYILSTDAKQDPENVDWLQEAIDAYTWAKANTKAGDEDEKLGIELKDMRAYAAAALYRLTGEGNYHIDFIKEASKFTGTLDPTKPDRMFGVWMYLLSGNNAREADALAKVKLLVTSSTDNILLTSADRRAARWGGDFSFPMLIGQGSTPMVTPGIYGYLLNKNNTAGSTYLSYLHTTADYYLGCNPLNTTWISGVGERYPVGLFHLDWWYRDKADPANVQPVQKGIIPYGPWRYENLGDLGWWNPNWAYSDKAGAPRIYPTDVNQWPGHERWFDMRISPLSSEFTIHQNTVVAAFVYGFLTDGNTTTLQEGSITDVENASAQSIEQSIQVFPNPAKEIVQIETPSSIAIKRIDLFTKDAKKVKTYHYKKNKGKITLDVRGLSEGLYILNLITSDNKIFGKKLLINK